MKRATLVLVMRGTGKNQEVLLGYKKKAEIGTGTLNGPGGKLEKDEAPIQGAVRETKEEVDIGISPKHLELVAIITTFNAGIPDFKFFVYRTSVFSGEPKETDHMVPSWHNVNNLPFDRMLGSDVMWFKKALNNKSHKPFGARVYYQQRAKGFERIEFHPLP